MRIRRHEVEPVLVHGDAARTDVETLVGRIGVVPDLMARTRIHGPHVVGNSDVQHAVHQQRRTFDGGVLTGLESPGEAECVDILRSDLFQGGVASAGIIAVIAGPTIGRGMQKEIGIHTLRRERPHNINALQKSFMFGPY